MITPEEAKKIIDSVSEDEIGESIEKRTFIFNKYYTNNFYINNRETGNKEVRIEDIKRTMKDELDEIKEEFDKTIIHNPKNLRKFDSKDNLMAYFARTASGTAALSASTPHAPYGGLVLPDDMIDLYHPSQKINTIIFSSKEDKSVNINIGEAHKPVKEGFWQSVLDRIVIGIIIATVAGIIVWFIIGFLE